MRRRIVECLQRRFTFTKPFRRILTGATVKSKILAITMFVAVELFFVGGFIYAIGQQSALQVAVQHQRPSDIAQRGLIAQEGATKYALWSAIAAVAQLPISIIGIAFVVLTIRQSNLALDHEKEVADTDLRPWLLISADVENAFMQMDADTIIVRLKLGIENKGKSLASDVLISRSWLTYDPFDVVDLSNQLDEIFHSERRSNGDDAVYVIPTDQTSIGTFIEFRKSHLNTVPVVGAPVVGIISLVVMCDYKWRGKVKRTARVFALGSNASGQRMSGLPTAFFRPGKLDIFLVDQHGGFVD
jgi:hypothetical protein